MPSGGRTKIEKESFFGREGEHLSDSEGIEKEKGSQQIQRRSDQGCPIRTLEVKEECQENALKCSVKTRTVPYGSC